MKRLIYILVMYLSFSHFVYAKCQFLNGYTTQTMTFDFTSLADREEFFNSSNISAGTLMIRGNGNFVGKPSVPFFKCTANETISWQLLWPVKAGGNYGYTVDTGDTTGAISVVLRAGLNSALIKNYFTQSNYFPLYNGTKRLTYKTSPKTSYTMSDVVDQFPWVGVLKNGNIKDNLKIPSGLFYQIVTSDGLELVRLISQGVTIKSGTCEIMNPLNQVYEFSQVHRWNNTTAPEILGYQNGEGSSNISIPIEVNCRNSTLKPAIKLSSETGFITSSLGGKDFVKPAGSASGIGMIVAIQTGANESCNSSMSMSQCYQKNFTFNGNKSSSGNYLMTVSGNLYSIEKWRDEYVGDYEFVVGYTLIYP
ncbi:hypothetical protein [Enterobacter genomosp. S]|nr:hypothetical protein [Enterobacter genomosp. S]